MIFSHRTNAVILIITGISMLILSTLFIVDSEYEDALKFLLLGSVLLSISYLERKKSRYE
jgi:hypothetical protein